MPDLYTRFVSGVLFPLQERLKKHDTVAVHRAMEASQWWSQARIAEFQRQRLRSFLQDVAIHVPYYRELFQRGGFDPATVQGIVDLQRLPFLDKAEIRAHGEALRADNAVGLARFNTGGSSGEPLIFHIGKERVSHDVAAKWRATRWWNVDIGDREIVVWGSPIELGSQDRARLVRDALMRTELLPAFEMSDAKVDDFVARIRQRRPKMLFGYPSAIGHIAQRAADCGVRLNDLGVKVVFCTAERLYDHQRSLIEDSFGCQVANGYGSRDAGFIAHECPHRNMHITAEDIVVEIINEEGRVLPPGQPGEIVVTHLATRDYPFIRYRTGDIAALSAEVCPCGRGLPLLTDIQGRSTDFVVAADGTVLHGLALIYVVRDLSGVRAFKIVQESLACTRVLLELESGQSQTQINRTVVEGFRARLGKEVDVVVEFVDHIPAEKSGKFRYVISHVAVR